MTAPKWPSERDEIADSEHLQAIGQFALTYNFTEEILTDLFRLYFPARDEYSISLYHSLNNRERIEILGEIVANNEGHKTFREYIEKALLYFDICTDNRNLVLHSTTEIDSGLPEKIRLSKRSRNNPNEMNLYDLSLAELRQVADDTANTFVFISDLIQWIDARNESAVNAPLPTLPEIPPQPLRLSPSRPPKASA